ncbi:MAG: hypothetical protein U9P49_09385, partial [Thermodesulfobacteriota bacterium]|nr:hypothetical protein [Thermodesulfobacteriota bacterium]
YNKRDLPNLTSIEEMNQILNPDGYPYFEAVATTGEGVLKPLTKISKMVLAHIEKGTSRGSANDMADHEAIKETPPEAEKSHQMSSTPLKEAKAEPDITGGRIQIVGTGDATIISANAINLPIKLKFDENERTYMMDIAIKLDKLIPED